MSETRQQGIVLIAVLWSMVLLALIASTVLKESRGQARLARNLLESARAEALADAGVHRAMAGLAKRISDGGWRVDRTVYAWTVEGAEVRIMIEDEGGKLDLNRTGGPTLRSLFEVAGVQPESAAALADAVQDFRDRDTTRRPQGAEDQDYAVAGLPSGAKDGPFEAPEELHRVMGMTRAIYEAVAPALTVHSTRRRPDRRLAPPLVVAALEGEKSVPAEETANPALGGEAADDAPQESVDGDVRILFLGPTPGRSGARTYTVHSEARSEGGGLFARRAVVRVPGSRGAPFNILSWGRSGATLFAAPAD